MWLRAAARVEFNHYDHVQHDYQHDYLFHYLYHHFHYFHHQQNHYDVYHQLCLHYDDCGPSHVRVRLRKLVLLSYP